MLIDVLVAGSHLRWDGVWQRPNHILSRLAQRVPVLLVEEPLVAAEAEDHRCDVDGLSRFVPHRRAPISDAVDESTLAAVREFVDGHNAAFWLYSPLFLPLLAAAETAPLLYDKMDELANFQFADPRIAAREHELLGRASVVFAGGRSLWESVRDRARAGRSYPSGVDVAHFAQADGKRPVNARPPAPLTASGAVRASSPVSASSGGPVFGYVGVLDERLDLGLIAELAAARPDASLLFVGPVAKIDPATLPRAANIVYLGQRTYAELPDIIASFDVALMPFAQNAATRFISPTKTLEYLAAGRPVVSTPIPDVIADFTEVVTIADRGAFPAAVDAAERPDPARRERGRALAAANTWDAIVDGMIADLNANGIILSG